MPEGWELWVQWDWVSEGEGLSSSPPPWSLSPRSHAWRTVDMVVSLGKQPAFEWKMSPPAARGPLSPPHPGRVRGRLTGLPQRLF